MKLLDDLTGCPRGNKRCPPDGVIRVGKARFERRGDVRQSRRAFWAVYRKRGEFALANLREHDADRQKSKVDPSRHHLGYCFRAAVESDVNGFEIRSQTETLRTQVRVGPNPRRCKRE